MKERPKWSEGCPIWDEAYKDPHITGKMGQYPKPVVFDVFHPFENLKIAREARKDIRKGK